MNTKKSSWLSPLKLVWMLAIWVSFAVLPNPAIAQIHSDYLNYQEMISQLDELLSANKDVMKLESIGQTLTGKKIMLVTLGAQGEQPVDDRPALLVAANLEGNQVAGTELSVRMIQKLLADYRQADEVKRLLQNHTVYFLPRINPDGAEQFLDGLSCLTRTNSHAYDGDNDGRLDEDGPEDLNRDGLITLMRVADPEGEYFADPENQGLLKKADPAKGESGVFAVYWEGLDNDGDGFINEDPVGGTDINRNFAHQYPYYQPDAGLHMVSENESRAVMDWLISHRNVAIMMTFSESDNLLNAPDSRGRLKSDREITMNTFADASTAEAGKTGMVRSRSSMRFFMRGGFMFGGGQSQNGSSQRSGRQGREAATTYNNADLSYYNKVSELYKETTGIKKSPPLRDPKGALSEYGYFQYGVLSLTNPGWGIPEVKDTTASEGEGRRSNRQMPGRQMAGRSMAGGFGAGGATSGGVESDLLTYMKDNEIDGFVPWTTFSHPDLGEVEIGGFKAFESFNPPIEFLDEMAEKQAAFVVSLGEMFANVEVLNTEVINHGDGIFRVKATVVNSGFLPTSLQQGVDGRSVKPTMVRLGIDPDNIISGDDKTNFIRKLDGSGNTESYEWLVKGKKGDKITIKVVGQKAGMDQKIIELQ